MIDIIREDTLEMKDKYGDDRRTEITGDVSEFNMEALIAAGRRRRHRLPRGYIKRLPVGTYRSQGRGGRGIKGTESREGDFVEHLFVANTHDYLLFFTNQGRVYERRVYDVPGNEPHQPGARDRQSAGIPGRRENRQRAGDQGFQQGRALPDVRHRQGHGEENRAERLRQHPPERHHRHRRWKKAIR